MCYRIFLYTNPWKYVSKKCDKKCDSLVCIDSQISDIAAFLELNPGISMTHRHPANWKIGSPFVPPDETKFHSGPRTICSAFSTPLFQVSGKFVQFRPLCFSKNEKNVVFRPLFFIEIGQMYSLYELLLFICQRIVHFVSGDDYILR